MKRMALAAAILSGLACGPGAPAAQPQTEGTDMSALEKAAARYLVADSRIDWDKPLAGGGQQTIDGRLTADSGRIRLRWTRANGRQAALSSPDAGASANISLLPLADNRLLLLTEQAPSAETTPATLRPLATVSGALLFEPLAGYRPPDYFPAPSLNGDVAWEKRFLKAGKRYRSGRIAGAVSGDLEVFWRQESGRAPTLITLAAPGAGELPATEEPLWLWSDDDSGMTFVCQRRPPLVNARTVAGLVCLAAVKTDALLAGLAGGD